MGNCRIVFMRRICFVVHHPKIFKRLKLSTFIFRFFLAMFLIALLPFAYVYFYKGLALVPLFWIMFLMFGLLTFLVCFFTLINNRKDAQKAVQTFMGATTIKLLVCLFFVLFYVYQYQVNHVYFIVCFFYLYLLNTAFEIYALLCNLRLQNQK
jgi:fatty acid desaturase